MTFGSSGTGTEMDNSIPEIQEWKGIEKFIPEIREREGNEKNPSPHFGIGNQKLSFPGIYNMII